jgi:hypothetical protein
MSMIFTNERKFPFEQKIGERANRAARSEFIGKFTPISYKLLLTEGRKDGSINLRMKAI